MHISRLFYCAVVATLVLTGCDGKELGSGLDGDNSLACNQCHGSQDNAAPPQVTASGDGVDHELLAGAHQAHLAGALMGRPVACEECHKVPEDAFDEGHNNKVVEVTFSGFAANDGAVPSWNKEAGNCSSTYCHGSTLSGGKLTAPGWLASCDACHGFPPESYGDPAQEHTADTNCFACHLEAVSAEGEVDFDGSSHPDATNCDACHGFPPPEPHPVSDTCFTCHRDTVGEDGKLLADGTHLNGELEASGPHPEGYASPDKHGTVFNDFGLGSCSECHGEDLKGGTSGVSCDKCHGEIFTSCTFCHGGVDNDTGAPPADLAGNNDTIIDSVGSHTSHLDLGADWHKKVVCADCHQVPSSILDDGHADGGHGDLTFGDLAMKGELEPEFEGGNCSSVYCHGATLSGGEHTDPLWSQVDGTLKTCTSCHGNPPPDPHPQNDKCHSCHGDVILEDGTFKAPEKHIDGELSATGGHPDGYESPTLHGADFLAQGPASCTECHGAALDGGTAAVSCDKCHKDWQVNCTFCHGGTDSFTGAPPVDMAGNIETTFVGVGAHTAHMLDEPGWHKPISCSECHVVPANALSPGHMDGEAKLTWGELASEEGTPEFNGKTCSSLYCHGEDLGGGGNVLPDWTKVDQDEVFCGSCHTLPPGDGHPDNDNCNMCHGGVINEDNATFKAPEKHINGDKDF